MKINILKYILKSFNMYIFILKLFKKILVKIILLHLTKSLFKLKN